MVQISRARKPVDPLPTHIKELALASASIGVVITDATLPDNPIVYVNAAFERMSGYTNGEALGQNCRFLRGRDILDKDPQTRAALAKLRRSLREERHCQVVLQNRRKDGTTFWNELTVSPVRNAEGRVTHFIGFQADITSRREAEAELERIRQNLEEMVRSRTAAVSEANAALRKEMEERQKAEEAAREAMEKYRSIFEDAVEGMFQSTPDGRYLRVNLALARLYGFHSPDDLINNVRNISNDVYVDPSVRVKFQEMVERDGAVHGLEYQVRRIDGSVIWIAEHARAVRDAGGKLLYYEGSVQDITARKEAEAEQARLENQLQQARKLEAIGTLAGGIAHDFNNILGAIIGFTQLCLDDCQEGTRSRKNLEHVLKAGIRAKSLVQQILTFSRRDQTERQSVEVAPLIDEALKLLRATMPSGVEMRWNVDGFIPSVTADPVQIHQVVMNLCTNAFYAMRNKGGLLDVSLDRVCFAAADLSSGSPLQPGIYTRITIRDTGDGMRPETLQRIFEPFFTTKPVGEGTGLGLAVVHGIVKNHGGDISVASEAGCGTVFQVLLPADANTTPADAGLMASMSIRGNERILLVDDEERLLETLRQKLERLGYKVTGSTSSLKALDFFRQRPEQFDLLIADQTMTDLTGRDLIRAVRKMRPRFPAILCAKYDPQVMSDHASRDADSDDYILKPIDLPRLTQSVRRLLVKAQPSILCVQS